MTTLILICVVGQTANNPVEIRPNPAKTNQNYTILVTQDVQNHFENLLPPTDDPELLELYSKKDRFIYYSRKEMPVAYQSGDGGTRGFHSVNHNFSAERSEPFGHTNREFPWAEPAGTDLSDNFDGFAFLVLPLSAEYKPLPIVYYFEQYKGGVSRFRLRGTMHNTPHNDIDTTLRWIFPAKTIFGEVGIIKDDGGRKVAFQLNTATKTLDGWIPNQFRPFRTYEEFASAILLKKPKSLEFVKYVVNTPDLKLGRMYDATHNLNKSFDQTFIIDTLPDLQDDNTIYKLLKNTPFRSTKGHVWRKYNNIPSYAPTAKSYSIVPKNFSGGAIAMTQRSCNRCHVDTHRLASEFESPRDWYGHVRGDDERLSFYIADPSCVAMGDPPPIKLNHNMIKASILEPYNKNRHTQDVYYRVSNRSIDRPDEE
jgi:hypothetical protein